MIRFMRILSILFFLGAGLWIQSCNNRSEEGPSPILSPGHITFKFNHKVEGAPLITDTLRYINAAGNPYEVNQVMYFISDVVLHKSDGANKMIGEIKDIHFVQLDIPSTLTWEIADDIPAGSYDSITFVFGIPEEKNKSYLFVNPPEDKMMWPEVLGGGYHYMMINGKWMDENDEIQLYNLHLGIGQLYHGNVLDQDSIYAFVQNYFTVDLPGSAFSLEPDSTKEIEIVMNIESWFESPHHFDFNEWGGAIMQIQQAMQMLKENGFDVFTTGYIR